jgi:hypothetical protein
VTVVALGSSIVAHGGCFNPPDQLLKYVRRVRERASPGECAPPGKPRGFLGAFMSAINIDMATSRPPSWPASSGLG